MSEAVAPSAGLQNWACIEARTLAREFRRLPAGADPHAFFAGACAKHRLLASLRETAEPFFLACVREAEGGAHGV